MNAELSRKLELQTQRLELVVAQHMANIVNIDATSYNKEQENYFVEGDEVCIIDFCIKGMKYIEHRYLPVECHLYFCTKAKTNLRRMKNLIDFCI